MNKEDFIKLEEKENEKIYANPYDRKYNFMLKNNEGYMNYTALSFGKRKITYEEMHESINKFAKILYNKGVRRGDVIGLCALNTPESVYLLYALDLIGAITVGVSFLDNKEKIKKDIEIAKPKMIITVDNFYDNFKNIEKNLNFSTILYSPLESADNLMIKLGYNLMQIKKGNFKFDKNSYLKYLLKEDLDNINFEKAPYVKEELTDIMFTGGSTGVHKGVDLSGEGLNHAVVGTKDIWTIYPGMKELGQIPFVPMVYGRMILHYVLSNNMEYALTLKAMPKDFYDELVRTHAEAVVGGPPHWTSLIEKDGNGFKVSSKIKKDSLNSLKYATSGGEVTKINTVQAINDAFAYGGSIAKLGDGLGATETWSVISVSNGRKDTPGTLGHKINCANIKLIDPKTNEVVRPGEVGLLYVSSPTVMLGYHNNEKETNKVITYDENGIKWCCTEDYLSQLPSGEYVYVGREKRNFVCDVENIYPEQIENLLINIPEIREVVVTNIPDDEKQFLPKYHISLYDVNTDLNLLESKIFNLVSKKLGVNWLPCKCDYYYEPLVRMGNTKIDLSYYKDIDSKESNGLILKK